MNLDGKAPATGSNVFEALVRRGFYSSAGTLVGRISAAVAAIVLARSVGAEQFGAYAGLWATVCVAVSFSQIGVTVGIRRDGTRSPGTLPVLLGNGIVIRSAIAAGALCVAFFWCLSASPGVKVSALYIPLAIAGFCTVIVDPAFAGLEVKGQQRTVAIIQSLQGVTLLIGFVCLAVLGKGLTAFAWYQAIVYTTGFLGAYFQLICSMAPSVDFSQVVQQVLSSILFGISDFLHNLYTQLPILLLSYFGTDKEVGYLAVALRLITITFMIGAAATSRAFIPALFGLYKIEFKRFREVCGFMQRVFVPMGILAATGFYVCADGIILTFLGEQYRPSIQLLRVMSWAVAMSYTALAAGAAMTAADRMGTKVAYQVFVTVIAAIVGAIATLRYGPIGASFLVLGVWTGLAFLYVVYAYQADLIKLCGFTSTLLVVLTFCIFGVAVTAILPEAYLLRPLLFVLVSLSVVFVSVRRALADMP